MTSSIHQLRDLIVRNQTLLHRAQEASRQLHTAAEAESTRLMHLIEGVSHAAVLLDDNKAQTYQDNVMQRAGLQRLLADR